MTKYVIDTFLYLSYHQFLSDWKTLKKVYPIYLENLSYISILKLLFYFSVFIASLSHWSSTNELCFYKAMWLINAECTSDLLVFPTSNYSTCFLSLLTFWIVLWFIYSTLYMKKIMKDYSNHHPFCFLINKQLNVCE